LTEPRRFVIDGEPAERPDVRHLLEPGRLDGVFEALLGHRPHGDRCPHCGTTQAEIEASGLVGCPLCYAVHETYLQANFAPPAHAAG